MTADTLDKPSSEPKTNANGAPSMLRRHGSQLGILGVGLAMWLSFVVLAPTVFLDVDIYKAFAESTPFFAIPALALTFVVITGEIDLSFPSIMALGTAAFCQVAEAGYPHALALLVGFATGAACGWLNGALVSRLSIPSLVITIGTSFLFRGIELVMQNGAGVALTDDKYATMLQIFTGRPFGIPIQTLWAVLFTAVLWVLLNRTRFGAHVFLVGDNPTSARLMGVNVIRVKTMCFVLAGLFAVFSGLMTSFVGNYFWPTTGEGALLSSIASVFLGGTSVFGGTGTVLGTLVASYIIGAINAGIVSAGVNAFYTQLVFGLVIVVSVVLQTVIERRLQRRPILTR
jgi:simple sugar transport system permease protein